MAESNYVFDDAHGKKKGGVGNFIWNSDTREFLGRDGASWGKITLFYAFFYAGLGSFFVGMLAVFVSFMPRDVPTYYGEASTMNTRGLNPGLGFRPHLDVEDHLISYNPTVADHPKFGFDKYVRNLQHFLNAKYSPVEDASNVIKCVNGHNYKNQLEGRKVSCEFLPNTLFAETDCTAEKSYGYQTNRPCVLIKMNKIISWTPEVDSSSNVTGVVIRCDGETSADKDNIKKITYHSDGLLNNHEHGILDSKFYPFFGQKSYRAPFVWVQLDVEPNTLVNVECKAYATNIDNTDRLNRRGQTKFSLFIGSK